MNEQLKRLRKYLDMTQQEFADRLGISRNTVATYEIGKSNPSDSAVMLICREFNVNEDWLRTGSGEMFRKSSEDDVMEMIDRIMAGENEFHKNLFKTFAHLDEKELAALESILDRFLDMQGSRAADLFPASDIPDTPEELEALCPPVDKDTYQAG